MKTQRDNIADEVIKYCMDVSGFSGERIVSAYKVADWYLNKTKGDILVSIKNAEEFMNKYGNFWVGTNLKLIDEIKEKLCQLKKLKN